MKEGRLNDKPIPVCIAPYLNSTTTNVTSSRRKQASHYGNHLALHH